MPKDAHRRGEGLKLDFFAYVLIERRLKVFSHDIYEHFSLCIYYCIVYLLYVIICYLKWYEVLIIIIIIIILMSINFLNN